MPFLDPSLSKVQEQTSANHRHKFLLDKVIKLNHHNQQHSAGLDPNHLSPGDRPEEIKDRKSIREVCESEPEAE